MPQAILSLVFSLPSHFHPSSSLTWLHVIPCTCKTHTQIFTTQKHTNNQYRTQKHTKIQYQIQKNANNQCQTGKHTNNQYQDRKSLIFSLASILLSGCKWSGCPTMQKRKEETNKQSINNVNNQYRARPSSVARLVSILLFGRVQRIWITKDAPRGTKEMGQTNKQSISNKKKQ